MENKLKLSEVLKKYTMVIVLAVVVILFTANTGGKMLLPQYVPAPVPVLSLIHI